jgi:hypothetical protein
VDHVPARSADRGGQFNCGERLELLPESVVSGGRTPPGAPLFNHLCRALRRRGGFAVSYVRDGESRITPRPEQVTRILDEYAF